MEGDVGANMDRVRKQKVPQKRTFRLRLALSAMYSPWPGADAVVDGINQSPASRSIEEIWVLPNPDIPKNRMLCVARRAMRRRR